MTNNHKKRQFIQYIPDISATTTTTDVSCISVLSSHPYYDISCIILPIHHHHYNIPTTKFDISCVCVHIPIHHPYDISATKIDISYNPIYIHYHYGAITADVTTTTADVTTTTTADVTTKTITNTTSKTTVIATKKK